MPYPTKLHILGCVMRYMEAADMQEALHKLCLQDIITLVDKVCHTSRAHMYTYIHATSVALKLKELTAAINCNRPLSH